MPLILPCCLKTVCDIHISEVCPLCEKTLSTDLTPNHLSQAVFESQCQRCEMRSIKYNCKTCKALLCKDCSAHLHSLGIYRQHSVVPLEKYTFDSEDRCEEHGLLLTQFCTEEWEGLCERCLKDHQEHPVLSLEEGMENIWHELNSKENKLTLTSKQTSVRLNKLKEHMHNLQNNFEVAQGNIKQAFGAFREQLNLKEEEILDDLNHSKEKKIKEIDCQQEALQKHQSKINSIVLLLQTASKFSPSVLFKHLKYLSGKIEEGLEKEEVPETLLNTSLPGHLDFSCLYQALEKVNFKLQESFFKSSPRDSVLSNLNKSPRNSYPKNFKKLKSLNQEYFYFDKSEDRKSATPKTSNRSSTPTRLRDLSILEDNPLVPRSFCKKLQSTTSIQVSWTHCSRLESDLEYILEYGIGSKINNVEQFRQVYKGPAHTCIITDLLPKTTYRFRVCAELGGQKGDWSEVTSISTHDLQRIDPNTCGMHATMINRANEKWVQFDRGGTVVANNPYTFGKYTWELKLMNNAIFAVNESSVFKVGVVPPKGRQVYGVEVSNFFVRGAVKVKVVLDVDSGSLTVFTTNSPQGEVYSSLPEGPLYPAFQYKPAKPTSSGVKFLVNFDKES